MREVSVLAVVLLALAGCSQGGSPDGEGSVPAADEVALRGSVLDPAVRPLAGATVTIAAANASAVSDEQGQYAFAELPRGTVLVLTVALAGFTSASRQATLPDTGETRLDVVLQPVVSTKGYVDVLKFEGIIGCQAAVVVSEGDPTASDCGSGLDPGKTVWPFPVAPALASAVIEVAWEPGSPAAAGLGARLEHMDGSGGNATELSSVVGRSPLRLVVPQVTAAKLFTQGGDLRLTVYAMPVTDEDEQAVAAAVAVDQRFQAFASLFYVVPATATYSFVEGT
ncbi:MAG TPA: carboxypeptidase-like regulatory domain-containing protein [Candidatus Thermoplasmatota archaeon]|nr:carboxypeptidase-like regulatory domain-containing protein [Candidatus Thermoplasmatota archaeon]